MLLPPFCKIKWARFTKCLARIRRGSAKLAAVAYTRSKSGRVSGGPGLAKTAAYTKQFCEAILAVWEKTLMDGKGPPVVSSSLTSLLCTVGFIPEETIHKYDAARRPALRRMTPPAISWNFCIGVRVPSSRVQLHIRMYI